MESQHKEILKELKFDFLKKILEVGVDEIVINCDLSSNDVIKANLEFTSYVVDFVLQIQNDIMNLIGEYKWAQED